MDKVDLPLTKVIPWVGAIVLASVAGTYTLTRIAITDQVEALKTQLNAAQKGSISIPAATREALEQPESLNILVEKISNLEKERQVLVSELIEKSIKALDPSSELAGLIAQLDSDSEEERREAVAGLFILADPRSLPSMVLYLNKRRKEATEFKYLFEWYDLFWTLDPTTALTFAISEFESSDPGKAERAYRELFEALGDTSGVRDETAIQKLEIIAVTSPNSLVRTRAKVLIQRHYASADADISNTGERPHAKPENIIVVFSILNRNGLTAKFSELVGDSGDITYWKTGYFLMSSFLVDVTNREKYISALEMLVNQPMAPNSLGLNLYFLAKMEQLRGNKERADHWLNECQRRVPAVCNHLMEQDDSFELRALQKRPTK